MKPFDLKKAQMGHPICTRDGRNARIICTDRAGTLPIIALVKTGSIEITCYYFIDGKNVSSAESQYDLFLAPIKNTGYVNIYQLYAGEPYCGRITLSPVKPIVKNGVRCLAEAIKIEWED
jgi:hypothetical protein